MAKVIKIPTNKIALAADGSDLLLELMAAGQVQVDFLKVGPWIGLDRMFDRAKYYPILLHLHNPLIGCSIQPELTAIQQLIDQTHPPFVSFHLDVPSSRIFRLWKKAGIPIPIVTRPRATRQAIENIQLLQAALSIPIAVENQAYHRPTGHDYLVDPPFINKVIQQTGCHSLLDLGHARVSAAMRGESADEYIRQLPLEHVIELHVSGPGMYRGRLRDLHHPLAEADYDLLPFTLERCPNLRVVTLEYYGPAELLVSQLQRLRKTIL
ncbi:MAG: DUF692 family protein [Chloroflexi bacterium]|nr:DUF692 family protein [Chloroflexota bacterium]